MENVLMIVEFGMIGGVLAMLGLYFVLKRRVNKKK